MNAPIRNATDIGHIDALHAAMDAALTRGDWDAADDAHCDFVEACEAMMAAYRDMIDGLPVTRNCPHDAIWQAREARFQGHFS